MTKPQTLDDLMADYEAERLAENARDLARYDSPEEVAKRAARQQRERDLAIREGWMTEDGEAIEQDEDEDEDEDDDEE
jgi:hypothetical protein